METRMSAAVVLAFPDAGVVTAVRESVPQHVLRSEPSFDELGAVRLDIRQSLLLLDIAVFRLRRTAPAEALELFARELAAIDDLLDDARAAARRI